MAIDEFGGVVARCKKILTSMSISIRSLFLGLFCRNNARDVVESQSVLIPKSEFWTFFTVDITFFDDLELFRVGTIGPC